MIVDSSSLDVWPGDTSIDRGMFLIPDQFARLTRVRPEQHRDSREESQVQIRSATQETSDPPGSERCRSSNLTRKSRRSTASSSGDVAGWSTASRRERFTGADPKFQCNAGRSIRSNRRCSGNGPLQVDTVVIAASLGSCGCRRRLSAEGVGPYSAGGLLHAYPLRTQTAVGRCQFSLSGVLKKLSRGSWR